MSIDALLLQADLVGSGLIADRAQPGILRALHRELADLQYAAAGDTDLLASLVEQRLIDSRSVEWTLQAVVSASPLVDEDAFNLAVLRLHHAIAQVDDPIELLDAAYVLRRQLPWTDAWRLSCDHARRVLTAQAEAGVSHEGAAFKP